MSFFMIKLIILRHPLFSMKNRFIYSGHYGEGNDVIKWIDINHVQIDSKIINLKSQ